MKATDAIELQNLPWLGGGAKMHPCQNIEEYSIYFLIHSFVIEPKLRYLPFNFSRIDTKISRVRNNGVQAMKSTMASLF